MLAHYVHTHYVTNLFTQLSVEVYQGDTTYSYAVVCAKNIFLDFDRIVNDLRIKQEA